MKGVFAALVTAVILAGGAAPARAQAKAAPATPENAASFLGEWTVAASGSFGDANLALTLKSTDGKVTGEVSDANGKHTLDSVSKTETSLVFTYVFDYQGMPIDAVVTLTPNDKDKTVAAVLDFAGGAAQFVGTATRKPNAKR